MAAGMTFSPDIISSNVDKEKDLFVFENKIPTFYDASSLSSPVTSTEVTLPWMLSCRRRLNILRQDIVTDLKATRWRHLFSRFCSHVLPLALIAALILIIVVLSLPRPIFGVQSACTPDGRFLETAEGYTSYSSWSRQSAFNIDLGIGSLSFDIAKIVDVIWDIVFGRGVQGILTFIAYKVCTKSLTRLMETSTVTNRTFEAITIQDVSLTGLYKMVRDSSRNGDIRAKFFIAWVIFSTSFLLSFQSVASAMTGYNAVVSAFVQNDSGQRTPASQYDAVQYIIHDGHRLGSEFYDDYPVVIPAYGDPSVNAYGIYSSEVLKPNGQREYVLYMNNFCSVFAPSSLNYTTWEWTFAWKPNTSIELGYDSCSFMWHVSEYVSQYGFLGLNQTNSTLNNSGTLINLPEPVLNISAYYDSTRSIPDEPEEPSWNRIPYGYFWKDPDDGHYPFQSAHPLFAYGSSIYNLSELNARGTCQQVDPFNIRYQWGFSSLFLALFAIFCLVWTVGTYIMYLDAYLNSSLDMSGRDIRLKRAIFDLHAAMKKDLITGEDIDRLGNRDLNALLKNGRRMTYSQLAMPSKTRSAQIRKWWRDFDTASWFRDEIVWLAALLFFTIMIPLGFVVHSMWYWWSPFVSWLPWLGTVIVIAAGRKHKSRYVHFALFFSAFWVYDAYSIAYYCNYARRFYSY